ncbi:hypothetical protein, partial [Fusicatenibacter sp.]
VSSMYSIHSNNSCINNAPFSFILSKKGRVHNLFTHAFVVSGYKKGTRPFRADTSIYLPIQNERSDSA